MALDCTGPFDDGAKAAVADLLTVETDARFHSFKDGVQWPDLIKLQGPDTKPSLPKTPFARLE